MAGRSSCECACFYFFKPTRPSARGKRGVCSALFLRRRRRGRQAHAPHGPYNKPGHLQRQEPPRFAHAHRGAADGEHARTRAAHRRQNHTLHGERLAARTATMKRTRATPVVGAASVRWLSDAVSKRRTGRQKRRRRRDRKRRRGAATMSRAESGSCVVSRKRISITAARWQGWTAALTDGTMAMVGECECVRGRARAWACSAKRGRARVRA